MTTITADLPLFQIPQKERGGFHASRLSHSQPTQRMLALLILTHEDGGATTWDIITNARIAAVNSHAANLNDKLNNIPTDCRRERATATGASVFRYRLRDIETAITRAQAIVSPERMTQELRRAITEYRAKMAFFTP